MTVKPYYQKMTQVTGFVLDIDEGHRNRFLPHISIQVASCSHLSASPCALEMLSCGFRLEICPLVLRRTGSNTWEVNTGSFFRCHPATSLCWKINWLAITLSTSVKYGCRGSIYLPPTSIQDIARSSHQSHLLTRTHSFGSQCAFCLIGTKCVPSESSLGGCSS